MASYHCQVKVISRGAGRSATAAAAYRAGTRINCEREGRTHDYTRKRGVEASFIRAPSDAPAWVQDPLAALEPGRGGRDQVQCPDSQGVGGRASP